MLLGLLLVLPWCVCVGGCYSVYCLCYLGVSVLVDVTRFIACVTLVCEVFVYVLVNFHSLLLVLPWCVCVGGCYSVYCLCYLGVSVLVDVTRFIACVTLVCEVFVYVLVNFHSLLLVLPWCVCVGGCYSVYCLCYLGVSVLVDVTRFIACVTLVCEVFVYVLVNFHSLLLVLPWCVCVGGCYSVYCLCYLGVGVLVDVTRFIACVTLVCEVFVYVLVNFLSLLLVLPWCVCVGGCYSVYCLCYLGVCVLVDVTRFIACVTLVCEVFVYVLVNFLSLLLVLPWCVCVGGCYSVYCLCYLGVGVLVDVTRFIACVTLVWVCWLMLLGLLLVLPWCVCWWLLLGLLFVLHWCVCW